MRRTNASLHRITALLLFLAVMALPLSAAAQTALPPTPEPDRSGYVEANGLSYYFAIFGEGEPLLLLHGGLGSTDMFAPVLPILSQNRQVIGIDLHGHGRTELGDRDISLEDIGGDIALILDELGYDQVDAVGYSFGGGAAFRLAVQHPEMVRRLVLVSAGFSQDGFYPEMIAMQGTLSGEAAEAMKETPMYQSYVAVAPHPEDFPRLLDQMGAYMRQPFDYAEDVQTLEMPVMIVFGDSDMYRPEHMVEFYKLLGGGQGDAGWMGENMSQNRLAILPGLTHYNIFLSPLLMSTILPFVNGQTGGGTWTAGADGAH